ncbi:hypothetical protein P3X46_000228 [Hevea brasiliensis]|uniref:Transcription factor CBF/NF-Y/archaeal histone domain-containing protein n=1 Tax=Hevea brasiliensis TaxID=3981 RepID=A0ABQ9N8L8_HEVBR|nr:DNA polymerase II subunit B3-1 [Hevea brasiliensis]KAJ9188872.1 hypothetical protein P3X46_000228 [Hevea brasiliensis]
MASTKKSEHEEEKKKKKKNKEAAVTSKSPIKKTPEKSPRQEKEKKKKKKKHNKTANGTISEPVEVLMIPSSSCDSQESQDETGEENAKSLEPKNQSSKSPKPKKSNKRKKKAEADNEDGEDGTMCRFPMARIKRIIKSEDPGLQLTQDVVFLVNKATEKFIEQFCEEAYGCSVRDRKNYLAYKHLSSAVSKQRRFDFLSDFVPEKLKAEDALAQRKLVENRQG